MGYSDYIMVTNQFQTLRGMICRPRHIFLELEIQPQVMNRSNTKRRFFGCWL